jgi:cytochrome c oxidase assembly protein subunit 15
MMLKGESRFISVNLITIISLFLLILAGGVVRSTGSGMGCPDWPKCFNQYIPPTDVSQLPADYKEKYVAQRLQKNERFAKMLDQAGYSDLAYKIRHDEAIKLPEEFNAAKTYTEYVNRLIGALTGVFLLLCLVYSRVYLKSAKRIFVLSLLNVVLVVFQAWLGSIVVSTNLVAWIITLHMLLAVLIIAISIYTYHAAKALGATQNETKSSIFVYTLTLLALVLSVIQITLGTEVREEIDAVLDKFPDLQRADWLWEVGRIYTYHKDLALAVVLVNCVIFYLLYRNYRNTKYFTYGTYMIILIGIQILSGLILDKFAMPPFAQSLHILFATLMFGAQFYLLLLLKPAFSQNKQDK